jgi:hypothetical protein
MAANGAVVVDWCPRDRLDDLQAFVAAQFRPDHVLATDRELLLWQHPADGDVVAVAIARAGDDLVGILGVIPVDVGVHGRRVRGGWLTTWNVLPAWRDRQVGLRLLQLVLDRYPFVGTLGGNATTMRLLGALRFHVRPSVDRWVLPLGRAGLDALGARHVPVAEAVELDEPETVVGLPEATAARWDETWESRLAPGLVGTWRDAAYLRHRYVEHPTFDYDVRFAVVDGAPEALVVHRVEPAGASTAVVRVVEALGDPQRVGGLVAGIAASARAAGAAFADFYCTGAGFARGIELAGFVPEGALPVGSALPSRLQPVEPEPRPLTIALRIAAETGPADPFAGPNVYFTRSDGDQDRPN